MTNATFQTLSQIVVAIGLVLTALGGFGAYVFSQRVEKEKQELQVQEQNRMLARQAYSGRLERGTRDVLVAKKNVYPKLEFADTGSILQFTGPQETPLFRFADDNHLTIVAEEGHVKVSVGIRDKTGRLVAEIEKNEWKVNPQNSWDRNYTRDALEVKDPSGDIVLQVRLVDDRVQFQAKLFDSAGRGIAFGKALGPDGWGGAIEITGPAHPKLQLRIHPIFKYPSDLHLGELVQPSKESTNK